MRYILICALLTGLLAVPSSAIDLTVYAQAYTPEIVTGDNPRPLKQFTYLARRYERLHPDVRISFIKNPVGDFRTWMITQLKGGTAPDIMWAHSDWTNQDAKYGWFVRLDPYLARPNPYVPGNKRWGDLFYADATDAKRAPDGSLYALPIDQVETGIFYNKAIFRKAGVSPPRTWEEFLAIQEKIRKAGYIPFLMVGTQEMWITWTRSILQDQLFNDLLSRMDVRVAEGFRGVDTQEFVRAYKKGIFSARNPRYRECLRILKDWSRYWQKGFLGTNDDRLFRLGRAAMFWNGSWYYDPIKRDPLRTFDFGVFPLPRLTRRTSPYAPDIEPRGVGGAASIQYAVTNTAIQGKKVEQAVDFLRFITAPKNLGPLVEEAGLFLPNVYGVPPAPSLKPFARILEVGHVRFAAEPGAGDYPDRLFRVLQGFLGGIYSEEQALRLIETYMAKSVDRLIEENPSWRFDANWDILPKGDVKAPPLFIGPPIVRYIPPAFLAALFLAMAVWLATRPPLMRREIYRKRGIYAFLVPSFLLLALFNYYPILSALYHSFFDWKGGGQEIWIGLTNFRELFRDYILGLSTLNALKLLLFGLVITVTVPLFAAELIFHLKNARAQYFYRVLFVVPMVVPGIVILLIWGFIYDYNLGLINTTLRSLGLERYAQAWLGEPNLALYSLMFMGFPWVGGFALLIYYAGLQNIPSSVLDSARIDGAEGLRRFRHVDLPLVMGQIKLLVVLAFIGGIQGFQTSLILTTGGPAFATMVPGLHLYQNAVSFDRMGYACAIGVVLFIVILVLTYINMTYLKSSMEYEAG
ncbi:MAG: extracellular solute-binding protein [Armatimonadetes bacterium]|nr:extracellular solute-binding protein [Armatimonadota bacterium]